MEAVATPARRPWRWPLGWLFVFVLLVVGSIAGWCIVYMRYGTKIPAAYFFYYLSLGEWLLLTLVGVSVLALVLAFKNAFRKRWRRALACFFLCAFSSGSCAPGYFLVVFAAASGIADDGHQNE